MIPERSHPVYEPAKKEVAPPASRGLRSTAPRRVVRHHPLIHGHLRITAVLHSSEVSRLRS